MTDKNALDKEFTVVMRGPSAVIFRPQTVLRVDKFPSAIGHVSIIYTSRWIKNSKGVTVPGHLWIEIKGKGRTLEEVLVPFTNAGIIVLPALSVSANAAIGDPEIELGFDSTPNTSERDYFQSYLPPESGVMHFARVIDVKATVALLDAINGHPDTERLQRAANQYRLALQTWRLGHASLSLAHLWMALEALTKVRIRAECAARGINSEQELAGIMGVALEQLDPTVKKDLLLKGDEECYRKSKKASDGFEHGFLGYDKMLELSKDVRHRMGEYVRAAILDLSGLEGQTREMLTQGRFSKPMGYWPVVKYIRGRLLGQNEQLARTENAYPFLRWNPVVTKCKVDDDREVKIEFDETFTPELGEGAKFKVLSYEAWKPE